MDQRVNGEVEEGLMHPSSSFGGKLKQVKNGPTCL